MKKKRVMPKSKISASSKPANNTKIQQEPENLYRTLFEKNTDGILIAQLKNKRFVLGNESICRQLGYTPDEIKTLGTQDIHPKKDLPYVLEQFDAQAKGTLTIAKDIPVLRKDGTVFYSDIHSTTVTISGKKFLLGVFRDITERRELEKRMANILEFAPDATVIIDKDKKVIGWNKAIERMTGVDKSQMIGKDHSYITVPFYGERRQFLMDLIDLEDSVLEAKYHNIKRHEKTLEAETFTPSLNNGKGAYVWALAAPLYDDDGIEIGKIEAIRDISDRKEAERIVKESEHKLRTLFDGMNEGVALHEMVYDTKGKAIDYRIIDINPSFEKQTGIKISIARGNLATDVYKTKAAPYLDIYEKVAKTCEPISFESYFPPLQKTFRVSAYCPKPGTFATVFTDITDLKRVEVELKRVSDLKTEFISTVSHEMRTPLAIIQEGICQILDGLKGPINPEQQSLLSMLKNNTNRMTRIIGSILDVSKIDAGKLEIKNEKLDLSDIIAQIVTGFGQQAKNKHLDIKTSLPDQRMEIYGDCDIIFRIFTNLLDNALKFTNNGYIEVSAKDIGNEIECAIADTGIGISQEDLPMVYERFKQFGRTYGPGEKGTGLGLAIIKEILDAIGGKIKVESQLGKGTKFIFTLPKQKASLDNPYG